jgi:hypothetical protein
VTPEARAARERKQKIFVVIGGLLLLALLAIQLPKLLGGSSTPAAAETTASADGTVAPTPVPTGAASPVALPAVAAAQTGKLTAFGAFEPKDPFVQQVVTSDAVAGTAETPKSAKGAGTAAATPSPTRKFSTGSTAATAVTIVTINGARQVLQAGTRFPASDPVFVLVAEKPSARSVVIGIVGGAYSGGAKTATLKSGKPLTLVNTATGARYRISLVSVGSGEQASEPAPTPKP